MEHLCVSFSTQTPSSQDCACLASGSCLSCCSCCQSCSADGDSAWLGNGLLSALEAFCSQLQVAVSGKQTPAPTVAAVRVAINSREQLMRQECLGCGIFFLSFCSAGLREHTFTCVCVYFKSSCVQTVISPRMEPVHLEKIGFPSSIQLL